MNSTAKSAMRTIAILTAAVTLGACGGTKVLKEPEPLELEQPMAVDSDQRVTVMLDWVIVRDGPGTWAKNADWDEYLLRVRNSSDQPVEITSVKVFDSSLTAHDTIGNRKKLVKATKKTARRYEDEGVEVRAGFGGATLVAVGGVTASMGMSAGAAAMYSSGAALGAAGALLVAPVLVTGGIVRGVNNSKVNREIETRQAGLPRVVHADETAAMNLFFPIAPSPASIEINYSDSNGQYVLLIDTASVLDGLHLPEDGGDAG